MMKKMLKAFFVIRLINFCPDFFDRVGKRLIRKLKLISNFTTSQTGQQKITIHVLPNISRSKVNHIMKFGQLVAHNMRNIFLKYHTQNVVEKLVPGPFIKKSKLAYHWIDSLRC